MPQEKDSLITGYFIGAIIWLVIAVAAILFNLLTALVLSTQQEVILPIRILLVNLLTGALFTAVAVVMLNIDMLRLATNFIIAPPANCSAMSVDNSTASPYNTCSTVTTLAQDGDVCRANVWFFRVSGAVRLCSLAVYSIAVMVVVIKGSKYLKMIYTIPTVIAIWIYAVVISIHWTVPQVVTYRRIGGLWCASNIQNNTQLLLGLIIVWIIFSCILPLAICTGVIISTCCYLGKYKLSQVTVIKRGLVKLIFFLFMASILNTTNQVLPLILIKALSHRSDAIIPYIVTTIDTLLLWSTATITVIFVKPVRSKMVAILCCFRRKRQPSNNQEQLCVANKAATLLDKRNRTCNPGN